MVHDLWQIHVINEEDDNDTENKEQGNFLQFVTSRMNQMLQEAQQRAYEVDQDLKVLREMIKQTEHQKTVTTVIKQEDHAKPLEFKPVLVVLRETYDLDI